MHLGERTMQGQLPVTLTGIGTGKARPCGPSVLAATAFPRSSPISSVKEPMPKGEPPESYSSPKRAAIIRSIYTTPKEIHHHSSSIPSPISSIAIAITIVIEISLRIGDHCKNIVISIQVFATMISIFDLDIICE